MLFQLILQDTQWYQFLVNAIITIIGRALDILSTRYVTKELKLETNRIARKIGWKGMLLMQIPIIILGSLDIYFSFFIFWWSVFLFANNIEGSWYIKQAGEEAYQKELKDRLNQSKTWKVVFSELSSFLKYTLAGIFILVFLFIFNDLIAILLISLAFIIQGIFGTISSILYLLDLKKDNSDKD
jgi:VIT1/CCC1 family predicted Fe2+/Mn2+ transporter